MFAVVAVLYCQDAIYRLSFIITAIFILIALHQVLSPKLKRPTDDMPSAMDFFDKMKSNLDRLKTGRNLVDT